VKEEQTVAKPELQPEDENALVTLSEDGTVPWISNPDAHHSDIDSCLCNAS